MTSENDNDKMTKPLRTPGLIQFLAVPPGYSETIRKHVTHITHTDTPDSGGRDFVRPFTNLLIMDCLPVLIGGFQSEAQRIDAGQYARKRS